MRNHCRNLLGLLKENSTQTWLLKNFAALLTIFNFCSDFCTAFSAFEVTDSTQLKLKRAFVNNENNDVKNKQNESKFQEKIFPEIKVTVSKAKSLVLICLLSLFDDENFSKHKYRESQLTSQRMSKEQHEGILSKVPFPFPQVYVERTLSNQCLLNILNIIYLIYYTASLQ